MKLRTKLRFNTIPINIKGLCSCFSQHEKRSIVWYSCECSAYFLGRVFIACRTDKSTYRSYCYGNDSI